MTTYRKTRKLKLYPKLSLRDCRLRQFEDLAGKVGKYLYRGRKKTKIEKIDFTAQAGYFFVLATGEHFKPVMALNDELTVDGVKLKVKNY